MSTILGKKVYCIAETKEKPSFLLYLEVSLLAPPSIKLNIELVSRRNSVKSSHQKIKKDEKG